MKIHLQILERVIPSPVARFWRTAARDLLFGSRRFTLFAITIGLAALFSASAQAQEPVPLARGNVPGEPHHHLKIENEYVRAYYVEVPPHESTQLHQHDHDYIYVSLGPADVVSAVLNKPEVHLVLKDGETHFARGGFAHVARNLSDKPFRNVTIELLKPQGDAKSLCGQILLGAPWGDCLKSQTSARGSQRESLLETEQTSVDLVRLDSSLSVLSIRLPGTLIVFLGETQIRDESIDAPMKNIAEGDVIWVAAGSGEMIWNSKKKDLSFLLLTFSSLRPTAKP